MANKLGSVVAIEPSTGGILAMISSPSYDPNLLRGSDRARNFGKLLREATKPLLNRAMQGAYNPGSTQKPLTALIALDVGAITPAYGFPCGGGYYNCGRRIGCTHSGGGHAANLRLALANSCNSYFCHIYRLSVDDKQFGNVKNAGGSLQDLYLAGISQIFIIDGDQFQISQRPGHQYRDDHAAGVDYYPAKRNGACTRLYQLYTGLVPRRIARLYPGGRLLISSTYGHHAYPG
ncbi:penicillin-binding protein, transpeptidase domain protein [Ostertagia ostertagi]